MDVNRQSFFSRAATRFYEAAERRRARAQIRKALAEVKLLSGRRLELSEEYFFMGACASLLETVGFIPATYVMEVARMDANRLDRGDYCVPLPEEARKKRKSREVH